MKLLYFISIMLILLSCSNGKIEFRRDTTFCKGDGAEFLVNKSKNKKIQFTIRQNPANQATNVSTKTYTLNPGDEIFIGCNSLDDQNDYKITGEMQLK